MMPRSPQDVVRVCITLPRATFERELRLKGPESWDQWVSCRLLATDALAWENRELRKLLPGGLRIHVVDG